MAENDRDLSGRVVRPNDAVAALERFIESRERRDASVARGSAISTFIFTVTQMAFTLSRWPRGFLPQVLGVCIPGLPMVAYGLMLIFGVGNVGEQELALVTAAASTNDKSVLWPLVKEYGRIDSRTRQIVGGTLRRLLSNLSDDEIANIDRSQRRQLENAKTAAIPGAGSPGDPALDAAIGSVLKRLHPGG